VNRIKYSLALGVFLLGVFPSWAQRSGAPASPQPSAQPGVSGPSSTGQQLSPGQPRGPHYVDGRVLLDTGQPAREPVSVELNCATQSLQVIRTDIKGYFRFTLGEGVQSNADFSASNSDNMMSSLSTGMNFPGGLGGFNLASNSLTGCELRASIAGYQPLSKTITPDSNQLGVIDVGTLQLRRIAGVPGVAISTTSLVVPGGARKEFEKGDKEARSNHRKAAIEHLEKAVSEYQSYAAAWYELGTIYSGSQEMDKARQAFEKAITADPNYIPPYVSLSALELKNQEYEDAVDTAGKALELDPTIGVARFVQAVGNFNLNRLDAAEKSAREVEKKPHQNLPQLHVLLADILLQKQEYANAAAEMRTYLKEFPDGQLAGDVQKKLDQIEKFAASAETKPKPPPEAPQTPPVLEEVGQTPPTVEEPGGSKPLQVEEALVEKPAVEALASPVSKRAKADSWYPPDVDRSIPQVSPGKACSLPDVLSKAGRRIEELVQNVDKFTATEVVEHQKVDRSGQLGVPEIRRFNYLVTIAQKSGGSLNVEEYRNGGSSADRFPDQIGTIGTPSLVLAFHPHHAKDMEMTCEGLGEWRGRPAWLVRFEERRESRNRMSAVEMNGGSFNLRLHGKAWILADSYQVARLESDLSDEIPKIRLRLQHQNIEYRAVRLPESKREIWLPSTSELYLDFLGHRFYRRHTFTDLKFFYVKTQQTFGDPKD
jgi:cytochrome c-type biogenesis protein CcmH/NrfG